MTTPQENILRCPHCTDDCLVGYGLCHCGCGVATTIADHEYPHSNVTEGQPFKFLFNHHMKRRWSKQVIEIDGGIYCLVPLTQGQNMIVDEDRFDYFSEWSWHTLNRRGNFYGGRTEKVDGKKIEIYAHDVVLPPPPNKFVDHINRNPLDNRACNLRLSSNAENLWNRGAQQNNTSGYKGVTFKKHCKMFAARIKANGIEHHIGYFKVARDAAVAWNAKAKELHGEFAYQNEV